MLQIQGIEEGQGVARTLAELREAYEASYPLLQQSFMRVPDYEMCEHLDMLFARLEAITCLHQIDAQIELYLIELHQAICNCRDLVLPKEIANLADVLGDIFVEG